MQAWRGVSASMRCLIHAIWRSKSPYALGGTIRHPCRPSKFGRPSRKAWAIRDGSPQYAGLGMESAPMEGEPGSAEQTQHKPTGLDNPLAARAAPKMGACDFG